MPTSALNNVTPKIILVCVGSELLRGKLNTHASYISRRLGSIGLSLNEEHTVSDEPGGIASALRQALERSQIILVSGGLGPTFDDLTREAASEATGRPLALSKPLLREIREKFRRAHYRMPPANTRQAHLLEGAKPISNPVGTAPGQWLDLGSQHLVLLPGPPRELTPMVENFVLPRLKKLYSASARAETHMHFVGVPESVVDAKIRPIIKPYSIPHPNPLPSRERAKGEGWSGTNVQFTILAHLGLVDFDVFVSSASAARARAVVSRIARAVRRAVGDPWYGSDEAHPLEKVVIDHLGKKRATLAVAESCTGGMLASRLTDIPGSSDVFVEGWVTYANAAKRRTLGVSQQLLKKSGAVSKPVALAMARGIRERAGSTWGVGITGIAGPGGGSPQKPVGLVYIGLASKSRSFCNTYRFSGDRDAIRQRAVLAALDLLRKA